MRKKRNKTSLWLNKNLRYIIAIMVVCSTIYYLPVIGGLAGWTSARDTLNSLHDLYGIDIYGILFFAPVVYVAYVLGVMPAVLTALVTMLVILPYAILIDPYPNALFKPAAFVIILSAVGAVIAMLQKSDEQRRRSMKELKCLYDIGKIAQGSSSTEDFLSQTVELIPRAMPYPEETKIRIMVRDRVFQSPGFEESPGKITQGLEVGGEVLGSIEISSTRNSSYLREQNHLTKTLAERIGGAVHEIELEMSLRSYFEQLEEMVEKRTRDLEQVQEKLIRSERLSVVGELASGVGHELRNPLNVIKNCVYLLNMTLADKGEEEVFNTLKVLDKQIDIANKIVTDLLDFTRIKAPSKTRVDLNNLINESLSWVAVPKNIRVKADLNGNSLEVKTDAEQVGRAFANIISNAVQAMKGKGELKINTGVEDGCVWAKFEDTGCGIPDENLEKIFEPLFTTKPKGIGLGLAITKRLVEQNGGKIEVASQMKKGTTFTVKLPLQKKEIRT
ncbi:MAG TPA: hypothetical protein ENJ92_00970 [Chloroflexi bacterium]|nr:hypothetical protein [Chloroflexota bacterium]